MGVCFLAVKQSLLPFSVGLAITILGGIAMGIVMAQWPLVEYVLDPFVNALYAIPRIALVPLIILWVGLEFWGKVTILVSVAIFPVIVNTYAGIKDVPGSMLEIGRAYGASSTQIFFVEYANNFATAKLFAPVIVIAAVGVVLMEVVAFVERRLSRWRISERERF
jgi:ABC-type nitrate/sulfonate/bicarbonate transport system permease component